MADDSLDTTLKNIDVRLTKVEQILPGLAAREELQAAVAQFATKEELRAAIAPLATREEMHAAIASAVAPLATREELQAAIAPLVTHEQLRVQRREDREHWSMLFEDVRDDIRIVLEHLVALSARVDALARR